jgi:hypothetical protein
MAQLGLTARRFIGEVENFFKFDQIENFTNAKSPPNGFSCSEKVSTGVEALIFLALAMFFLNLLPMRFFLLYFFRCFTIWVPPVLWIVFVDIPL